MNIKISRMFYLVLIVFAAALFLPKFYWMKFEKNIYDPMVYYSPVSKEIITTKASTAGVIRKSEAGKNYSREQFEALMPLMNYRQLFVDGKLPDSLNGVPLTADVIRINNLWMRIRPHEMDFKPIQLFPMFESKSGRVRLEMPNDYFRITDKFEFIDCATNKVLEEKSKLFTDKLLKENFQFPAVSISGNPNPKKAFDEGYFVLDSKNDIYHIKMVKGKPFCANLKAPKLNIFFMKISETALKESYGFIFTKTGDVYLISYRGYKLIKLPLENYDIKNETFAFSGDMFYRTISLASSNKVRTIVTDRNYQVIKKYEESWQDNNQLSAGVAAAYLFPFTLNINDGSSSFANFFFKFSDSRAWILSVILTIAAFFILKKRNISLAKGAFDILLVLLTGVFGFIAVLLVKNIDNQLN